MCDDGVDGSQVNALKKKLSDEGAMVKVVASHFGTIQDKDGKELGVDDTVLTSSCVLFDALAVPNGTDEMFETMNSDPAYKEFVRDTYLHFKPIAVNGAAVDYTNDVIGDDFTTSEGIVEDGSPQDFVNAVKEGRFWNR